MILGWKLSAQQRAQTCATRRKLPQPGANWKSVHLRFAGSAFDDHNRPFCRTSKENSMACHVYDPCYSTFWLFWLGQLLYGIPASFFQHPRIRHDCRSVWQWSPIGSQKGIGGTDSCNLLIYTSFIPCDVEYRSVYMYDAKAKKERVEALRRKLSNQPSLTAPSPQPTGSWY